MFTLLCGINSAVECQLPKLKVASSNLVSRSKEVFEFAAGVGGGFEPGVVDRPLAFGLVPPLVPPVDEEAPWTTFRSTGGRSSLIARSEGAGTSLRTPATA